jgi:peptidyl-prolyl cis-trans isomerase C
VNANRSRNIQNIFLTLTILLSGILLCTEAIAAKPVAPSTTTAKKQPIFATVGNNEISWKEYKEAYLSESNTKFYHAKPNEAELAAFQRQVGEKLITNALLVQEAKRRKLKPDNAAVQQELPEQLQKYEKRFANDPNWPEARKRVLPIVTPVIITRLQDENIRTKLEELVRNVPPPTTQQLRQYYDANPKKFTSPPQPRVSVILLRVDPSSSDDEWNKAMEEGEGLVKRARAGEDFATLARDYSGDITAEEGGDMGYMHSGMLPGLPEETVSKLQPGETSDPVKLLEGIAIFRLTDRILPAPSSFESSEQRIRELWLSEQSDIAWNSLIKKLRKNTPVKIDESRFLPLTSAAKKPAKSEGAALPVETNK